MYLGNFTAMILPFRYRKKIYGRQINATAKPELSAQRVYGLKVRAIGACQSAEVRKPIEASRAIATPSPK